MLYAAPTSWSPIIVWDLFENLQGGLMRMTSSRIAESTFLQRAYKYWWSQMSRWSHMSWWLDTSYNLLHPSHLQWLRVQHVKGQTGDLCSIYKSMAAGARRTETDEKGGAWRPVPLVIPGEKWAWTLPRHTDLFWTYSGHYYAVHWGIYMADWQALGVQANGYNNFFIFSDVTTNFSLGTKNKK